MGSNPLNLAFRFVLELVGLVALGVWAWSWTDGPARYVLAIGVPVAAAAFWGIFNVPGDSSRSGKAPVEVPGAVRLLLELVFFASASWALCAAAAPKLGVAFAIAVLFHYVVSYDRVLWLLGRGTSDESSGA